MTTISEKTEQIWQQIERNNLPAWHYGVFDDEDLIIFALNYLEANLNDAIEPLEETEIDK